MECISRVCLPGAQGDSLAAAAEPWELPRVQGQQKPPAAIQRGIAWSLALGSEIRGGPLSQQKRPCSSAAPAGKALAGIPVDPVPGPHWSEACWAPCQCRHCEWTLLRCSERGWALHGMIWWGTHSRVGPWYWSRGLEDHWLARGAPCGSSGECLPLRADSSTPEVMPSCPGSQASSCQCSLPGLGTGPHCPAS